MQIDPLALTVNLYQTVSKDNPPRVFKHWHASSMAECPRSHYFKRMAVPALETASGAMQLRWQVGHQVEEVIRPYLKQLYPELRSNVRFTNETLDLTGELDNYDPVSRTIIEIKSVHPQATAYRPKGANRDYLKEKNPNYDPSQGAVKGNAVFTQKHDPYAHHEIQNHGYVLLISHPDTLVHVPQEGKDDLLVPIKETEWAGATVHNITYLYITLSGLLIPYTTQVKEHRLSQFKARLASLEAAWEMQMPPVCICQEGHEFWGPVMQYCDYRQEGKQCCSPQLLNSHLAKENHNATTAI